MLLEGLNNILLSYDDTVSRLKSLQEQQQQARDGASSSVASSVGEPGASPAAGEEAAAGAAATAAELVLPNLDLSDPDRRIWIFTTAWVTLVVPWLEEEDQGKVYPGGRRFGSEEEQDAYVHQWLVDAGMPEESENIRLLFYRGRYHKAYGSIFPMGDLTALVPDGEADVCILEEPEHLNWFRAAGALWTDKFNYVIGIIHTNYIFYAGQELGGTIKKEVVRLMSAWMVRAHCHRVVKLSAALQTYAPEKEVVCNVHGVREQFLSVGERIADEVDTLSPFTKGVYFIGKTLWSKGYEKLLPLLRSYRRHTGENLEMEAYGDGPDKEVISKRCARFRLAVRFCDAIDHVKLEHHKVFVNPSRSEVLCTTVAEALAMGKFVVCARHASNEFFYQFPNCLPFRSKREFVRCIKWAREHEPEPLTPDLVHQLTWSAATDRLVSVASAVECSTAPGAQPPVEEEPPAAGGGWAFSFASPEKPKKQPVSLEKLDNFLANLHLQMSSGRHGDVFRKICGAGPAAAQSEFAVVASGGGGGGGGGVEADEDGFIMVEDGGGGQGGMHLSRSELSLLELLSTGIHKGVVDNVLTPLVDAYRHFVDQGQRVFMRQGAKEALGDVETDDAAVATLPDVAVRPPPGCNTDDELASSSGGEEDSPLRGPSREAFGLTAADLPPLPIGANALDPFKTQHIIVGAEMEHDDCADAPPPVPSIADSK